MHEYLPFEATKQNHLRYYFDGDQMNHRRTSPWSTASLRIGGIGIDTARTFNDTLRDTSLELLNRHGQDFVLFLSGGLDSEVAFRSMLSTGLAFKVVIVRFANGLNDTDVKSAVRLCTSTGVSPLMIDFDPVRFHESGRWQDVALRYDIHTFYQQMLVSVAEQMACPMITVDEIEMVKSTDDHWIFIKKEDQDGCWHRFMRITGIPSYNNFYTYDPATMLAFLSSPTVTSLISNQMFGKLSWTSSKHQIYSELTNWEMLPRPKQHGMEMMMDIWYDVQNRGSLLLKGPPVEFEIQAQRLADALHRGETITCDMI